MNQFAIEGSGADLFKIRWPGLAAYSEADHAFFYGRSKESEELFRCVERETLTVIFGPSGVGKTSLLNAGLFHLLQNKHYLPVRVRIDFSGQIPIARQVKDQFQAIMAENGLELEACSPRVMSDYDESLWEFIHRQRIWDDRNWPITPVLAFDQFEEIFTLGKSSSDVMGFITELSDLVENHIPIDLRQYLDSRNEKLNFPYQKRHYKVILTLREDFVSRLDGLRPQMPSVMHNRFYLGRMNGDQALLAVLGPGEGLVAPETADKIIRFVGDSRDDDMDLQKLEIEPALLSVVCRELNLRRIKDDVPTITSALLSGNQEAILEDFYARSIQDLPPDVRIFIEDDLLTSSGYRNSMAVEDVLHKYRIDDAALSRLVDRRLLRMERGLRVDRVELIHDLLTGVVQLSRDKRQEMEAQAKEKQRAAELHIKLRRSRLIIMAFASIAVIALYFMVIAIQSKNKITKNTDNLFYNDLVRKAQIVASEKPRIGLLLIMEAMARFKGENGPSTIAAEESFREILSKVSGTALTWEIEQPSKSSQSGFYKAAVSNNGQWIAAATGQGDCIVWNIGPRAKSSKPIVLMGHKGRILDLSFHPNNMSMATAGSDQTIRLWDLSNAPTKQHPIVLHGNGVPIYSVEFSPEGHWLASAGGDKTLRIWDIQDLQNPRAAYTYSSFNNLVYDVAFSPDGRWLAAGSLDNSVLLCRLDQEATPSLKIRLMSTQQPVSSVDFTPDSHRLAIFYDNGRIELWDLTNLYDSANRDIQSVTSRAKSDTVYSVFPGTKIKHFILNGHTSRIQNHSFQSNGKWMATAALDHSVLLWDLSQTSQVLTPIPLVGDLQPRDAVAFHPAGRWLASGGGNNTILLWDMASEGRKIQHVFRGFERNVAALQFDQNGSILTAVGSDHTMRYWNFADPTPTFEPIPLHGHTAGITALTFSDDGKKLFSGSQDGTARIWDLSKPYFFTEPVILKGHYGPVRVVAKHCPSGLIATAGPDDPPRLWDLSRAYDAMPPEHHDLQLQNLIAGYVSPDRDRLILQGADSKLWLVHVSDRGIEKHSSALLGGDLSFRKTFYSRRLNWLAAIGWSNQIYLLNIDPHQTVSNSVNLKGHHSIAEKTVFSPNEKWLLTVDLNEEALLWRLENILTYQKPFEIFGPGSRERISVQVFSPDDRWLITGTRSGKFALWDLGNHQPNQRQLNFAEKAPAVVDLAFNPQGNILVTTHDDFSANIWNFDHNGSVRLAKRLNRFHAAPALLRFSPSGRELVVALRNGQLYVLPDFARPESAPYLLESKADNVTDIEYSADEKWLLLQFADGPLQVFRKAVEGHLEDMPAPVLTVESKTHTAAFSPDNRWLINIHPNGDLLLTVLERESIPGAVEKSSLSPHLLRPSSAQVVTAVFDRENRHLIAVDEDGILYRWNLLQAEPWSTAEAIPGAKDRVASMAFLQKKRQLIIEDDLTIKIYDVSLEGSQNRFPVVANYENKKITLPDQLFKDRDESFFSLYLEKVNRWYQSYTHQNRYQSYTHQNKSNIENPDTDRAITAAENFDMADRRNADDAAFADRWVKSYFVNVLERFQSEDSDIYWSHNSRFAARLSRGLQDVAIYTESESGNFQLFGRLKNMQTESVSKIALSADGRYLGLGYKSGRVGLLDLSRPISKENVVILGRHDQPESIDAMAFSPDSKLLATGSQDASIIIWPVDIDNLIRGACLTMGRSLNAQEWKEYMQDRKSLVSCTE